MIPSPDSSSASACVQRLEARVLLSVATDLPSSLHVNAGGDVYVDAIGREFAPDIGFTGGIAVSVPEYEVQNTLDPALYFSFRSGNNFEFSANVAAGNYVLLLEFADSQYTVPDQRKFDVFAQGERILDDFDIIAAAGAAGTAVVEAVKVHVDSLPLKLRFVGETGDAIVSAISLVPTDVPAGAAPYSWQNLTESERTALSFRNLRWIGNALYLYAGDHKGRFPNGLDGIAGYFGDVGAYIAASPRTSTLPPRGLISWEEEAGWFDSLRDYIYLAAGKRFVSPGDVLVYENPDRVYGDINVLLGDGHAEKWDRAYAAARIGFPLADPSDPPAWPAPMTKDPSITTSATHLANIANGLLVYSNKNHGRYPTNLGVLFQSYGVALENFVNPRTGTQLPPDEWAVPQKVAWINSSSDYVFPGAGLDPFEVGIAVCENPLTVAGGINVVTSSGIVEYRDMRWGLESIAARTAPMILGSGFDFESAPQSIRVSFSEGVFSGLDAADLVLTNLTTGQVIPSSRFFIRYDWDTFTAHFDYDTGNFGLLPDGNYRATLLHSGVSDSSGKHPAANVTFDFFVLGGDANRDRVVNVVDLAILAANWGKSGRVFSDGDFSLDGTVDAADLGILAAHWQMTLPPLPPRRTPIRQPAAVLSALRDEILKNPL